MSMSRPMLRKWRSAVVNTLRRKRLLTDTCKITAVLSCGTVTTACGKRIRSAISAAHFESVHHF